MRVLVVGLGSMGMGAAKSLIRGQIETVGLDVNPLAIENFSKAGGFASNSISQCGQFDCVLIFVIDSKQVEEVLFTNHFFNHLQSNALVINCVTMAPSDTKRISQQVAKAGFRYIDAPVSGGPSKALEGRMSIMASGAPDAIDDVAPIFKAISEKVFYLGETPGAGSQMKLINQLLAGVHIAAAAEAMNLAQSLNMDLHEVIKVISHCAGTSWMFENRAPHIADGDYRPLSSVNIFVKDLSIVANEASSRSVATPLSDTALALYKEASDLGLGNDDDSSIVKILAARSNITLPGS